MSKLVNAIANQKSKILNPIGKSVNRSIGKSHPNPIENPKSKILNSPSSLPSPHPIPNKDETSNSPIPIPIVPSPLLGLGESKDFNYWDRGDLISKAMEELDWPDRDRSLLEWYFDRLGPNRFLTVWQDQTFENEKRPPRSKYRAFRARLSKALGQTPSPSAERAADLRGAHPQPSADLNPHPPKGK